MKNSIMVFYLADMKIEYIRLYRYTSLSGHSLGGDTLKDLLYLHIGHIRS